LRYKYLALLFILISACAQKPTRVSEIDSSLIQRAYLFEKKSRPIKIVPETVVLDTRSFFDYQLFSLPAAVHVDPQEYLLRRWQRGNEEAQAAQMARRLALLGVSPMIHVVVIGKGTQGHGEEGEVALALMALGVERVQLGNMEDLKAFRTRKEAAPHANQLPWRPRDVNGIFCSQSPATGKDEPVVIDLRKRDWKKFLNKKDSAPNAEIKDELAKEKVSQDQELRVVGAQAPLVVFSLLQLGYSRACLVAD
jgi:thiosulfate/3-mercaptopyruvate sulfurtransferase